MANRLKKIMNPIIKEECNKAFERGFEEGKQAGWDKRVLAYENQIECLKNVIKGLEERAAPRFLFKDGEIIPLDRVWIPVSKRLPNEKDANEEGVVLVRNIGCPKYDAMDWDQVEMFRSRISHWISLPEPPKGE